MKLNKQITCNKSIDDKNYCHLTELSEKISRMIDEIIVKEDLTESAKNKIEKLDKLSILKIAGKDIFIKQIIEDSINNDFPIYTNNKGLLYQLEVFGSKYHIEIQNGLNSVDKNLFSIQDELKDKPITEDLIMVLSCNNELGKYYVLYKVQNFDFKKDI